MKCCGYIYLEIGKQCNNIGTFKVRKPNRMADYRCKEHFSGALESEFSRKGFDGDGKPISTGVQPHGEQT